VNICVYCSASTTLAPVYYDEARRLGEAMAARGDTLIYGGGSIGLMGEVARAMHTAGGRLSLIHI
jgi:predicted Rossmann-fold nucleotide-binding protein